MCEWLRDALIELNKTHDFDDISITDICKAADVSRYTFYNHYESKEELLLDAINEGARDVIKHANIAEVAQFLETGDHAQFKAVSTQSPFLKGKQQGELIKIGLSRIFNELLEDMKAHLATIYEQVDSIKKHREQNEASVEAFTTFVAGGYLALLESWLNDQLPIEAEVMDGIFREFARTLVNESLLKGQLDEVFQGARQTSPEDKN